MLNIISIILFNITNINVILNNRNDLYSNPIGLIFILLTNIILGYIYIISRDYREDYLIFLLWLSFILLFSTNNLLIFYISFELVVILIIILIIIYGSREKKIEGFYKLWLYSFTGSIFLFITIVLLYMNIGSTNNYILELYINYTLYKDYLFLGIFFSFIIKLPTIPVHSWLTLAHVEADTVGSVILAALILKISIYGMYKYNIIIFYTLFKYYSSIISFLAVISIIYISNIILNILDMKLIIAYSSIIHTNLMVMPLFTGNSIGIYSSIISSVAHGLISSSMFICINVLYSRYNSRNILYYSSLIELMPLYIYNFFIVILSNISMPLTSNFIGEILYFIVFWRSNILDVFITLISILFTVSYNIILFNRLAYNQASIYINKYIDLIRREYYILYILTILNILLGIFPIYILL